VSEGNLEHLEYVPVPELPELGELLTADFDGKVIRPGDVLLLGAPANVTMAQMDMVRNHLREKLPKLADVIILGGLTVQGIFRDEDDDDADA
jgi:hypothetical protein